MWLALLVSMISWSVVTSGSYIWLQNTHQVVGCMFTIINNINGVFLTSSPYRWRIIICSQIGRWTGDEIPSHHCLSASEWSVLLACRTIYTFNGQEEMVLMQAQALEYLHSHSCIHRFGMIECNFFLVHHNWVSFAIVLQKGMWNQRTCSSMPIGSPNLWTSV